MTGRQACVPYGPLRNGAALFFLCCNRSFPKNAAHGGEAPFLPKAPGTGVRKTSSAAERASAADGPLPPQSPAGQRAAPLRVADGRSAGCRDREDGGPRPHCGRTRTSRTRRDAGTALRADAPGTPRFRLPARTPPRRKRTRAALHAARYLPSSLLAATPVRIP